MMEQIQTNFFIKFKNPVFGPFLVYFSNFFGKIFLENPALSHTYQFLAPFQNLEKTKDTIPRNCLDRRKDKRLSKETYILLYRTLMAAARGLRKLCNTRYFSQHEISEQEVSISRLSIPGIVQWSMKTIIIRNVFNFSFCQQFLTFLFSVCDINNKKYFYTCLSDQFLNQVKFFLLHAIPCISQLYYCHCHYY